MGGPCSGEAQHPYARLPWAGSDGCYSLAERLLCGPSSKAYLGIRRINVPRTEKAGRCTARAVRVVP